MGHEGKLKAFSSGHGVPWIARVGARCLALIPGTDVASHAEVGGDKHKAEVSPGRWNSLRIPSR